MTNKTESPPLLIRAIWFILFGWELTGLWLLTAWIVNLTVIGIPIGIKMINWVPKLLTLKGGITRNNTEETTKAGTEQRNILTRALYFILIGWWASLIWTGIGYILCVSVIGLPFGIWMLNRLPEVTSLYSQK